MKPSKNNLLITLAIMAGLIITHGCGSDKTYSSSYNSGSGAGSGNTEGVTVSNEVESPSEMGVGDIIMLQFSSLQSGQLDFEGVEGGSRYYLAVGQLDYNSGSHSVRLDSTIAGLESKSLAEISYEESKWDSWTTADAFDQRLRDIGLALAADPEVEMASPGNAGLKAAVNIKSLDVGETEEIRVLNSLTSVSSYATVTARVRCVKENIVLYVDAEVESVNPDDLEEGDIQALCEDFNDQVALERNWFGDESDVNGDGKVAALLTPQVNRLGAMGGGIITGFFLASDLYARSGSNSISNEREIVYALVPDSAGTYGVVIPTSFAKANLLTAVLPHELQHVISYNRHVFEGEGTPELNWLNEGMSHLVEDMVGYGQENYSRASIFLNYPHYYQLAASGSPDLGERGAAYLFMRFLYEQHPDPEAFLWGLYHNSKNGVANIEAAFSGNDTDFNQFGEFFMRWMTALALTNRGLSSDSRYVYRPREYNYDTDRWQGICLVCDADDGRGTIMNGPYMETYSNGANFTMYSSTARFYDVSSVPDTIDFSSYSYGTFGAVLIRKQ